MKTALCISGAACVWDDLDNAKAIFTPDFIVAVNTTALAIEVVDHWVSYHPDKFQHWVKCREAKGWQTPPLWSHMSVDTKKIKVRGIDFRKGSSSLLAIQVARHGLGCDRIVGCGMPMTIEASFFDGPEGHKWREAQVMRYRSHWSDMREELRVYARSMSGWTAELLGKPDAAWLASRA